MEILLAITILLLIGTAYSIYDYRKNPWKNTMLGLAIFLGILTIIMMIVIADRISLNHYDNFSMLC